LSEIEQRIKNKIEAIGTPLEEWGISINYGIKTGYNEAFIINGHKKDELISKDPKSAELIRPILRGRDIKRYSYSYADLYLICTFPSKHYDIDRFPAIKKHLLMFGKERLQQTGERNIINGETIQSRKKTKNKWFETQDSIDYWDDFYRPKIMYNDINQRLSFCLADEDVFCNNTVYFISDNPHNKYLLACLNSKVIDWYYKTLSVQLGSNAVRMFSIYVEKIPVPKTVTEKSFEFLIDSILKKSSRNEDFSFECDMIDQKLFNLFDLSHEESDYINSLY